MAPESALEVGGAVSGRHRESLKDVDAVVSAEIPTMRRFDCIEALWSIEAVAHGDIGIFPMYSLETNWFYKPLILLFIMCKTITLVNSINNLIF